LAEDKAMTVNERLVEAGLLEKYDAAVSTGDAHEINRVLAKVGLRQDASGMNWTFDNDA
jgi:hypothetical protein